MATEKQVGYIKSLMIEKGFAHEMGYLRGGSKRLPHGPTMRERNNGAQSLNAWASRLTKNQASDVIDALLKR